MTYQKHSLSYIFPPFRNISVFVFPFFRSSFLSLSSHDYFFSFSLSSLSLSLPPSHASVLGLLREVQRLRSDLVLCDSKISSSVKGSQEGLSSSGLPEGRLSSPVFHCDKGYGSYLKESYAALYLLFYGDSST